MSVTRVMPTTMAPNTMVGLSPMVAPNPKFWTRYRILLNSPLGCHEMACPDAYAEPYPHEVDIEIWERDDELDSQAVRIWAMLNVGGRYAYAPRCTMWRWFFEKESDAVLFKMRWG